MINKKELSNRFEIYQLIGGGSFGHIYNGIDTRNGEGVAIKIEHCETRSIQLCNESKMYRILNGAVGIPVLRDFVVEDGLNALVIDILGDSIESLFKKFNRHFSLRTVLMLAEQLISRVQFLHSKGIVHNDLKPSNLMTGVGPSANVIYLIDFGLATKFRGFYSNLHEEYQEGQKFFGTPEFASINSHKGVKRSRRDDLESIAYILIYFMKEGKLPWNQKFIAGSDEKQAMMMSDKSLCEKILLLKEKIPVKELCHGLPEEFAQFLQSARNLKFDEDPDYSGYKKMFRDLFTKKGFLFDENYDWTNTNLPKLTSIKNRGDKCHRARALTTQPPTAGFTASASSISKMLHKKNATRFKIQGMGLVASCRSRLTHVNSLNVC